MEIINKSQNQLELFIKNILLPFFSIVDKYSRENFENHNRCRKHLPSTHLEWNERSIKSKSKLKPKKT